MVDKKRILEQLDNLLKKGGGGATVCCDSCFRTAHYSVNSEMEASLRAFKLAIEQGNYDYAFSRGSSDVES